MLQTLKLNISCKRYTASQPQASINDCLTYQINKPHGEEVAVFALRFKTDVSGTESHLWIKRALRIMYSGGDRRQRWKSGKEGVLRPAPCHLFTAVHSRRVRIPLWSNDGETGGKVWGQWGKRLQDGSSGETLASSFFLQYWNSAISVHLFPPDAADI